MRGARLLPVLCSALALSFSTGLACAPAAVAPKESRPVAVGQLHRFTIGALPAIALKDGDLHEDNDGKTFGLDQPPSTVASVLAAAGLPTTGIDLSMQPLLVRDGERTLLFDTGAAGVSWAPQGGRLLASLRAAGVEPASITDIFISHSHPDHVGGLLGSAGTLAFPAAAIHLSAPEWETMKKEPKQAALVAAMTPRVAAFAPGAALLPAVTAVPVEGHTPGHSAYAIASGAERLLYIGDSAHHSVISVERPDWFVDYDMNRPLAQASRRALLQRAAAEDLRIYAVHFPFPGIGRVKARGESFVWVPEGR